MPQQPSYTQSIQPGGDVVEDDAPSFRQLLELPGGKGFGDVKQAKEDECDESGAPVCGATEQGDPLACDFVNDDKTGVVAASFTRGDCGGGNAESDGKNDTDEKSDLKSCGCGVGETRIRGPEQHCSDGAPRAGARPA